MPHFGNYCGWTHEALARSDAPAPQLAPADPVCADAGLRGHVYQRAPAESPTDLAGRFGSGMPVLGSNLLAGNRG
jgi:hypothetical protein